MLRADASWPASVESPSPVPLAGGELPAATGAGHLVAVRHRGELLGALSVTKKRGDAVTPTEDRLIGNLATQAGLVLRNAGLTEQLLVRLAELRACAKEFIDNTSDLAAEVDGVNVQNLAAYRHQSPLFTFGPLPEDNILGLPAGTTAQSVDDGIYLLLAPLSVGEHMIHFTGTFEVGGTIDTTYNIIVMPR